MPGGLAEGPGVSLRPRGFILSQFFLFVFVCVSVHLSVCVFGTKPIIKQKKQAYKELNDVMVRIEKMQQNFDDANC